MDVESNQKRAREEDNLNDDDASKKQKVEDEKPSPTGPVKLGPKCFGSSLDMFDYFYNFLHAWSPFLNVNKIIGVNEGTCLQPQALVCHRNQSCRGRGFGGDTAEMTACTKIHRHNRIAEPPKHRSVVQHHRDFVASRRQVPTTANGSSTQIRKMLPSGLPSRPDRTAAHCTAVQFRHVHHRARPATNLHAMISTPLQGPAKPLAKQNLLAEIWI